MTEPLAFYFLLMICGSTMLRPDARRSFSWWRRLATTICCSVLVLKRYGMRSMLYWNSSCGIRRYVYARGICFILDLRPFALWLLVIQRYDLWRYMTTLMVILFCCTMHFAARKHQSESFASLVLWSQPEPCNL